MPQKRGQTLMDLFRQWAVPLSLQTASKNTNHGLFPRRAFLDPETTWLCPLGTFWVPNTAQRKMPGNLGHKAPCMRRLNLWDPSPCDDLLYFRGKDIFAANDDHVLHTVCQVPDVSMCQMCSPWIDRWCRAAPFRSCNPSLHCGRSHSLWRPGRVQVERLPQLTSINQK